MAKDPKDKDRSFTFRVTQKTLKELDELRKKESDLPTRGEMLRRLVERATAATKPKKEENRSD
jgi:hypothetical protein